MPTLNFNPENAPPKNGTRLLLLFGRIKRTSIELKKLNPRKRRDLYLGRRNRTAVILTVAKGRGQRRA